MSEEIQTNPNTEKDKAKQESANETETNKTIDGEEQHYEQGDEHDAAEVFDELGEGDGDDGNVKKDNNEEDKSDKDKKDDRIDFASKRKAIDEDELDIDELLKAKIKLDDGSEHFIFSRGPKYSDESWPVNCHLCRMGNLIAEEQIKFHIKGKRHIIRLEKKKPDAKLFSEPFFQCAPKDAKTAETDKQIKIYPGEIISEITEEYADRVIKPEEFDVKPPADEELVKKLSKEPIHDYNEKLPVIGLCYMYKMNGYRGLTYYCTLCSMRISGNAFKHVTGEPHQIKYIIRHFPKLYDKVVDRLSKIRGLDVRLNVRNIFRKLYRKIENAKGFRKIAIVDDDDFFKNLKKYALKTRFDQHYEESTILITEHEVDVLIKKCINGMEFIRPDHPSDEGSSSGGGGRRGGRDGGRDGGGRGRGRSPKRRYIGDDYAYDWARYRDIMHREIDLLNAEYKEYDHYPSSHPRYNIEENKYFNTRKRQGQKKELIRREWQRVWRQRLRDMYDKDLDKRKIKAKRLLRLPFDERTPSPSPPRMMHRSSDAPYDYDRLMMYGDRSCPRDMIEQIPPPVSSGPLGVISCLRLLTALEDHLGSLGPKAVQLLSRAVLTEKNGKNPNDLMMENDYYVYFVTAKEKLKGQLFANIIDPIRINAIRRAVQDCSTLLEMFEDYMRRQGKPMPCSNNFQFDLDVVDAPINQYSTSSANQYSSTNNGSGGNSGYSGSGNVGGVSGGIGGSGSGGMGNNYSVGSSSGSGLGGSGYGSNQGIIPPIISYPDRNVSRNLSGSNKW